MCFLPSSVKRDTYRIDFCRSFRRAVARCVVHPIFDGTVLVLILVNAVLMGMTDYNSIDEDRDSPTHFWPARVPLSPTRAALYETKSCARRAVECARERVFFLLIEKKSGGDGCALLVFTWRAATRETTRERRSSTIPPRARRRAFRVFCRERERDSREREIRERERESLVSFAVGFGRFMAPSGGWRNDAIANTDLFFLFAFSLEMAMKVVAMGFVGPCSYLSDSWNMVDFLARLGKRPISCGSPFLNVAPP